VRGFNLLLSFKEPEIKFPTAEHDIIGPLVKNHGSEPVFGPVTNLVKNRLNASVCSAVPNFNNFVSSQRDQMIFVFIKRQVLNRSVMAIQVAEDSDGEGIPHEDVSLLAATGHKPVLE